MNEQDKLRFARYRKGYVQPIENENDDNSMNNKTQKIGYISNVEIKADDLIKKVINKKQDI
jgi:hypothetical protein